MPKMKKVLVGGLVLASFVAGAPVANADYTRTVRPHSSFHLKRGYVIDTVRIHANGGNVAPWSTGSPSTPAHQVPRRRLRLASVWARADQGFDFGARS